MRKIKTYNYKNMKYRFNTKEFNKLFSKKVETENLYVKDLEEDLGKATHSSRSTVHSWRNKTNGPVDIGKIKLIADFFNVEIIDLLTSSDDVDTYTTFIRKPKNGLKLHMPIKEECFEKIKYILIQDPDKEMYTHIAEFEILEKEYKFWNCYFVQLKELRELKTAFSWQKIDENLVKAVGKYVLLEDYKEYI